MPLPWVDAEPEEYEDDDTPYNPNLEGDLWGYHDYPMPKLGFWDLRDGEVFCLTHRERRKKLFFGVENELTFLRGRQADMAVRDLCAAGKPWTAAEDSSLNRDYSAEFISDPMTLAAWQKPGTIPVWHTYEAGTPSSYGMHIHVSRNALSPFTLAKLDFLMYVCHREFQLFARRQANHYCEPKREKPRIGAWDADDNRYRVLNFTKVETIEFRLFRATARPERTLAAIEFCDAVIKYCQQASIRDIDWPSLRAWFAHPRQRKSYHALTNELIRVGLLEPRKAPPADLALLRQLSGKRKGK